MVVVKLVLVRGLAISSHTHTHTRFQPYFTFSNFSSVWTGLKNISHKQEAMNEARQSLLILAEVKFTSCLVSFYTANRNFSLKLYEQWFNLSVKTSESNKLMP